MSKDSDFAFTDAGARYVWAEFADLYGGRCDRAAPVVLVDARDRLARTRCPLRDASPLCSVTAEAVREREVWVVISSVLDLWAADVLAEAGGDVIVVRDDPAAACGLGLAGP